MSRRSPLPEPGEPTCPHPGCERVAGFGTDRRAEPDRPCFRHRTWTPGAPAKPDPRPTPRLDPRSAREPTPHSAPGVLVADPLARRLTGETTNPTADPLAVMRVVLSAARSAGLPFDQAWALGAEAALSYMPKRKAEEWWRALDATERAWAGAYARQGSRLAALTRG